MVLAAVAVFPPLPGLAGVALGVRFDGALTGIVLAAEATAATAAAALVDAARARGVRVDIMLRDGVEGKRREGNVEE